MILPIVLNYVDTFSRVTFSFSIIDMFLPEILMEFLELWKFLRYLWNWCSRYASLAINLANINNIYISLGENEI